MICSDQPWPNQCQALVCHRLRGLSKKEAWAQMLWLALIAIPLTSELRRENSSILLCVVFDGNIICSSKLKGPLIACVHMCTQNYACMMYACACMHPSIHTWQPSSGTLVV